MSASPSRRDLCAGLFAAGLAWLGLRHAVAAAALTPAVPPPQPNTETPSRLPASYGYLSSSIGRITTATYDGSMHLVMMQGPTGVTTLSYSSLGKPPNQQPPEKA
jgi:hypothetical protein